MAFAKHKNTLSAALGGSGGGPITSRSVSERRAGSDDVSKWISFQHDDGENSDPNAGCTKFEAMMPQKPSMLSINSTMLHQSVAGNDSIINLSVDSFRPSSTYISPFPPLQFPLSSLPPPQIPLSSLPSHPTANVSRLEKRNRKTHLFFA